MESRKPLCNGFNLFCFQLMDISSAIKNFKLVKLPGLCTKRAASPSKAFSTEVLSPDVEKTITGMFLYLLFCCNSAKHSNPFFRGIFKSNTIKSGFGGVALFSLSIKFCPSNASVNEIFWKLLPTHF
jgi:hypothetical protein